MSFSYRHWIAATVALTCICYVNTAAAPASSSVEEKRLEDLISTQRGNLPVVISAPHGGSLAIPGAEPKEKGTTVKDLHTAEVAVLTAQFLTERLDGMPYYAIAQFSRQFVDANRGPGFREEQAYSGENAKGRYDAYHETLRRYVDEVRETFGRGLLIDLHGQSARPGAIIRGTNRGETVTAMLDAGGIEALTGPRSVFGKLAGLGYSVEPPVEDAPESPEDEELFIGGYIVRAYGSHHPDGIDSIQIELGRDFRQESVRRKTAMDLAEAIATYVEAYILAEAAEAAGSE